MLTNKKLIQAYINMAENNLCLKNYNYASSSVLLTNYKDEIKKQEASQHYKILISILIRTIMIFQAFKIAKSLQPENCWPDKLYNIICLIFMLNLLTTINYICGYFLLASTNTSRTVSHIVKIEMLFCSLLAMFIRPALTSCINYTYCVDQHIHNLDLSKHSYAHWWRNLTSTEAAYKYLYRPAAEKLFMTDTAKYAFCAISMLSFISGALNSRQIYLLQFTSTRNAIQANVVAYILKIDMFLELVFGKINLNELDISTDITQELTKFYLNKSKRLPVFPLAPLAHIFPNKGYKKHITNPKTKSDGITYDDDNLQKFKSKQNRKANCGELKSPYFDCITIASMHKDVDKSLPSLDNHMLKNIIKELPSDNIDAKSISQQIKCSITHEPIKLPMLSNYGTANDCLSILNWLNEHQRDPNTNKEQKLEHIIPDLTLFKLVNSLNKKTPHMAKTPTSEIK